MSAEPKFCYVLHHVFWAISVLVMKLCYNKNEGYENERRVEVMDACRMLKDGKDRSIMAKKFLQSLMDILRKNDIRLLKDSPLATRHGIESASAPVEEVCVFNNILWQCEQDPHDRGEPTLLSARASWHVGF